MKKENKEQLKEMLNKFYSETEAQKVAEDIESGDNLIASYPVLEPAETTKWRIKAAIAKQLRAKKQQSFHRKIYHALAAVAVIVIVLAMARFIGDGRRDIIETIGGEGTDIFAAMDAKTTVFSQEIDQIGRQFTSLQFGQTSDEEMRGVDELETEYILIASDFWKGE